MTGPTRGVETAVDSPSTRLAVAAVTTVALLAVAGSLTLASRTDADANAYAFLVFITTCAVVGHVITSRRPGHPVGWLLQVIAVCFGLQDALGRYTRTEAIVRARDAQHP